MSLNPEAYEGWGEEPQRREPRPPRRMGGENAGDGEKTGGKKKAKRERVELVDLKEALARKEFEEARKEEKTSDEARIERVQSLVLRPEEEEFVGARTLTEYVIDHGVKDYQELNPYKQGEYPASEEEALARDREIFYKVARGAIKELVVHGVLRENEQGELELLAVSDSDGKAFLTLFEMAGFGEFEEIVPNPEEYMPGAVGNDEGDEVVYSKTKGVYKRRRLKITYANPGETVPGAVVGDTGRTDVNYNRETRTASFDHHSDLSKRGTSAARYAYEALVDCGLLEPRPDIQDAVDFVTYMDNNNFPKMHTLENFKASYKSLIGLSRYMDFRNLVYFFYDPARDPREPMSDRLLKEISKRSRNNLIEISNNERAKIESSLERVEELRKEGYEMKSDRYGRVLVDIGGTVVKGADAAFASGFDTYIGWTPEKNGFVIRTKETPIEVVLNQGFIVRENMWIKPKNGEPLTFELGDLLEKLGVSELPGAKPSENVNMKQDVEMNVGDLFDEVKKEEEMNVGDFLSEIEDESEEVVSTPKEATVDELLLELGEENTNNVVEETPVAEIERQEIVPEPELVTEIERNERLISEIEAEELRLLEEQRERQLKIVEELRRQAEARVEEESKLTFGNLFKPSFWRSSYKKVTGFFRRLFG